MGTERERFVTIEEGLHVESVTLSTRVLEHDVAFPQRTAARPRRVTLDRREAHHFGDRFAETLTESWRFDEVTTWRLRIEILGKMSRM